MDSVRTLIGSVNLPNFNFKVGNLDFSSSYLQVAEVIFLIFVLIMALAQFRRHLMDWSIKGALFGLFFGFLFALILEGFLLIGGKTAVTEVIGWKAAPKPLLTVLDLGKEKLVNVLGVTSEIPLSSAKEKASPEDIFAAFRALSPEESEEVKEIICKP